MGQRAQACLGCYKVVLIPPQNDTQCPGCTNASGATCSGGQYHLYAYPTCQAVSSGGNQTCHTSAQIVGQWIPCSTINWNLTQIAGCVLHAAACGVICAACLLGDMPACGECSDCLNAAEDPNCQGCAIADGCETDPSGACDVYRPMVDDAGGPQCNANPAGPNDSSASMIASVMQCKTCECAHPRSRFEGEAT